MSISLNDITRVLKENNKKHPKNNIDHHDTSIFRQPYSIPINKGIVDNDDSNKDQQSISNIYHYDQVLEVPNGLNSILDLNNYYSFGTYGFVDSILFSLNSTYKLLSRDEKNSAIQEFGQTIKLKLDTFYEHHNSYYKEAGLTKSKIESIIGSSLLSYNLIYLSPLISSIKNINIYILDVHSKLYTCFKSNNPDVDPNIILFKMIYNDISYYLPIVHIYGESFSKEDCDTLIDSFKESIYLKKISHYTLQNLQTLADNYSISCTLNSKKKTKQQLYDELSVLCI